MRKLVSRLVTYSVTVPHLNANRVYPKKDHSTSSLSAAFLQLGKGTNLILNEKEMMPGFFFFFFFFLSELLTFFLRPAIGRWG